MLRFRTWLPMTLVIAFAAMNGGCILIPEIKDRLVELAVAGTTSAVFTVQSNATSVDETDDVDVGAELNLAQILSDAGIDVSRVKEVALTGVSYRILSADPNPAQEITNGAITIQRPAGTGPEDLLVTALSAAPGAVGGFENITLQAQGVGTLNQLLTDMVAALPGAPTNPLVRFHLTGSCLTAPNFQFEIKITISVTGTVDVRVPT